MEWFHQLSPDVVFADLRDFWVEMGLTPWQAERCAWTQLATGDVFEEPSDCFGDYTKTKRAVT